MKEPDQSKKSSRYARWMVASCGLLALLWPLGNFVFWIMLGFISYFGFLYYYYLPKSKSTSEKQHQQSKNPAESIWEAFKRAKSIQFAIAMGFLGVVIVWFAINGTNNSAEVQFEPEKSVNIDSLVDVGNERYNSGEYESALKVYDEVLRVDPTNQFGLYNKALVFYGKKDFRKSISLINYCIQQHPNYGPAYFLLGDDFKFLNQVDSALYFFDRAYDLGVRDGGLLQNLGDIYYDQKKKRQAIQFYKEAVEQDTTLSFVYERLAELEPGNASLYERKAALVRK